jgi:hypothetical protein
VDNVAFVYLYRDGGNHKKWGRVVFSDPDRLIDDSVEEKLRLAFLQDGMFIALQIRVPEMFLYASGKFSFDDHCYHEFDSVRATLDVVDDALGRSITQFLAEVTQEAKRGWREFDPIDSEGSFGHFLTPRLS